MSSSTHALPTCVFNINLEHWQNVNLIFILHVTLTTRERIQQH
jgi:hypothetical protein